MDGSQNLGDRIAPGMVQGHHQDRDRSQQVEARQPSGEAGGFGQAQPLSPEPQQRH